MGLETWMKAGEPFVLVDLREPAAAEKGFTMPHDHRPSDERTITLRGREYAYMQQSFWCGLATLAGLPAAVVPAGVAADGLPVGVQIIGPYLGERTVLEFAALVESTLGAVRMPAAGHGPA